MFEAPEYEVRGKTRYDQTWIDGTIVRGVDGCGWAPPKERPASLDAPMYTKAKPKAAPPPKRKWYQRRAPAPASAPVSFAPVAPKDTAPTWNELTTPVIEPPKPKPPRTPIEELLDVK